MMRRWRLALMLLVMLTGLILPVRAGYAQESQPVVVFIEDTQLRTASLLDPGPDGVTELEAIFKSLGARTIWLKLDEPLPADAQIVVLIRPLSNLPATSLARIWRHMASGGHLFLALDPSGLPTVRGEASQLLDVHRQDPSPVRVDSPDSVEAAGCAQQLRQRCGGEP